MATTASDTGSAWRVLTDDSRVIEWLEQRVGKTNGGSFCSKDSGSTFGCDRETAREALALADTPPKKGRRR